LTEFVAKTKEYGLQLIYRGKRKRRDVDREEKIILELLSAKIVRNRQSKETGEAGERVTERYY